MANKIVNAKIKYSYLGFNEDAELIIEIGFDCDLGFVRTKQIEFYDTEFVEKLLNALELQRWEDLPRKYARVEINDDKSVIAIGNLIKEEWLKVGEQINE